MQENLPIGGNLYFELNRIAYDNNLDRRRKQIENIHDYSLHVSTYFHKSEFFSYN